jgi:hypothetical protein
MSTVPLRQPAPVSRHELLDRLTGLGAKLPRPDEVSEYLSQHSDIVNVVTEVIERARDQFGSAELVLIVNHDPEMHDPYLMLYVRESPYPPNMLERLNSIWEPIEAQLTDNSGWLVVSTDFREPGSDGGII